VVDENLYFEVDVDPGSYIAEIHKVGYTTDNDLIKVDDMNTTFGSIQIYPRSIDRYTSDLFIDTFIDIPPRSYAVYTFNVTELCNMFLEVSSDQKVHVLVQTHEMYLNYLEWSGKGSFEFERPWDLRLFDFASGSSRHSSMDIVAWSDPFHITIENNNSVSTRTVITLRYEDANLEDQGFEVYPLGEETMEDTDFSSFMVISLLIMLILIFLLSWKKHRSRQEKMIYL